MSFAFTHLAGLECAVEGSECLLLRVQPGSHECVSCKHRRSAAGHSFLPYSELFRRIPPKFSKQGNNLKSLRRVCESLF